VQNVVMVGPERSPCGTSAASQKGNGTERRMSLAYEEDISTDVGFGELVRRLGNTKVGKDSYNQCLLDIRSLRESCAIVETVISRITLKVCFIFLTLLIMMEILVSDVPQVSTLQGLHQLHTIRNSSEVSPDILCEMVRNEYSLAYSKADLLVLVIDKRFYWTPDCECCDPWGSAMSTQVQDILADGSRVDKIMQATGLEAHELTIEEVASSVAVWDRSKDLRAVYAHNLLQTGIVVILLGALIVYFATDMKRLSNENVLHPLWILMDDMCAMRSVEVLVERGEQDDKDIAPKFLGAGSRLLTCPALRPMIPVADELVQLREVFDELNNAMYSWSKFVPVSLLLQLFAAGVEANIGCIHRDVSILFGDIQHFRELCEDTKPIEMLALLSDVLNEIYETISDHGGTLLEFIGSEVLAVFNAPNAVRLHSRHALNAALDMIEHTANLKSHSVRLQCSLHRATVLVGNIGAPTRMKYGMLGDGVNLAARLKGLNSRYSTQLLVSAEALDWEGASEQFLSRPVGNLYLKGRTVPTRTFNVIARKPAAPDYVQAVNYHTQGFQRYLERDFTAAVDLFSKAGNAFQTLSGGRNDLASQHLRDLSAGFLNEPPPPEWDGSERLLKKAW